MIEEWRKQHQYCLHDLGMLSVCLKVHNKEPEIFNTSLKLKFIFQNIENIYRFDRELYFSTKGGQGLMSNLWLFWV